jgi:hypothetical protein
MPCDNYRIILSVEGLLKCQNFLYHKKNWSFIFSTQELTDFYCLIGKPIFCIRSYISKGVDLFYYYFTNLCYAC